MQALHVKAHWGKVLGIKLARGDDKVFEKNIYYPILKKISMHVYH